MSQYEPSATLTFPDRPPLSIFLDGEWEDGEGNVDFDAMARQMIAAQAGGGCIDPDEDVWEWEGQSGSGPRYTLVDPDGHQHHYDRGPVFCVELYSIDDACTDAEGNPEPREIGTGMPRHHDPDKAMEEAIDLAHELGWKPDARKDDPETWPTYDALGKTWGDHGPEEWGAALHCRAP